MIDIIGTPGPTQSTIRFTPRPEYRKQNIPIIERDLIFGHKCPTCRNVVQALFVTEEPINLWHYEETNVISIADDSFGDVLRILPGLDSKVGSSQYTSIVHRTSGDKAQHLTLKNHIIRYHGLNAKQHSSERFYEPGGNTCYYNGVFSMREDLMLKDLCLAWRMPEGEWNDLANYRFDKIETIADGYFDATTGTHLDGLREHGIRMLPAYGEAPPVLVFSQKKLRDEYEPWSYIQSLMRVAFRREQS